jgi:hypothetical protein
MASQERTSTEEGACIRKALTEPIGSGLQTSADHIKISLSVRECPVFMVRTYNTEVKSRCMRSDIRSGGPRDCGGIAHVSMLISHDSDNNLG